MTFKIMAIEMLGPTTEEEVRPESTRTEETWVRTIELAEISKRIKTSASIETHNLLWLTTLRKLVSDWSTDLKTKTSSTWKPFEQTKSTFSSSIRRLWPFTMLIRRESIETCWTLTSTFRLDSVLFRLMMVGFSSRVELKIHLNLATTRTSSEMEH